MKTFVSVIDTRTGISQYGMIEESVEKGLEISNALGHFGIQYGNITWHFTKKEDFEVKYGEVDGTSKIVFVYQK